MDTTISAWREQIEAVTPPLGDKIARLALDFLETEHAQQVVELGWSELELFGLYNGDLKFALVRADTRGLIPAIGLSISPIRSSASSRSAPCSKPTAERR